MDDSKRAAIATLRAKGLPPKAIARQLGLRPAEVSAALQQAAATSAPIADDDLPVVACLISPGWSVGLGLEGAPPEWSDLDAVDGAGVRGLASILIARRRRYGDLRVAGFLTDVYCLGVKDAFPSRNIEADQLSTFASTYFRAYESQPIEIPFSLAQALILGAVEYARALGFSPHPDFEGARSLVGTLSGPSPIVFGDRGKPHFVNGPHDDIEKVIATLRASVGEGNFGMTVLG